MRFRGAAFRAHNPRWSWDPLSGKGAGDHGGRFNPKGVPALYLSLSWNTAVLEASQGFPYRVPPLTIVSYDVDCEDIADLTTAPGLRTHRTTRADLGCAWKLLAESGETVPSWRLAARLQSEGVAGIIVPSFATRAESGANNLVLWRWIGRLPHRVAVFDPDARLPRNDASWRNSPKS